jgi:predicted small secreted protein
MKRHLVIAMALLLAACLVITACGQNIGSKETAVKPNPT